jgi:arylsulfatase A-like enzyme
MMTEVPPMLWTRSLIRNMPYFRAQEAWQYIDDANTHFALKHLLAKDLPVTIIWLPETDTVSHKRSRGQFGCTRRTIALADRLIGKVVDALETRGMLESTYFMLVSDHGHHGGRDAYLTHFDLANDLFHRPRQVDQEGNWVGGGLGLSVRQHRFWNRHPEDGSREFVFIDGDSDGAARVFLPKGHFRSGEWMGGSQPADLLQYRINDRVAPINLPATIAATRGRDGRGEWQHPIDLVLMPLSDTSVLITTHDRGQAVIDRKRNSDGRWNYRYRVVHDLQPSADGSVSFEEVSQPSCDPLGLTEVVPMADWGEHLNEQEWLTITAKTRYPDSVVALTRHMLWQDNLAYREGEYAPDLVVTAKPNWYFGTKSSPGTMHGYPFRESMRATWFVSGPNIRRGARLAQPVRLADLTPTILHLIEFEDDEVEFDGRIVTEIFQPDPSVQPSPVDVPVYWQDVDLAAWQSLAYQPATQYEHLPWTINRPERGYDLSNIAYNLVAIGDISVWRIFDDVVSPLTGGEDYLTNFIEDLEQQSWKLGRPAGEAAEVIDLSGLTVGDYSQTSVGHLQRVDRAVDWVQARSEELDRALVKPIGFEQSPPVEWTNYGIDAAQFTIWESYRFVHRVAIELLDETLLNGLENATDRGVHELNQVPAEEKVIRVVTPADQ